MIVYDTNVIVNYEDSKVKNLITDYQTNFQEYKTKLYHIVAQDEELSGYLANVLASENELSISILDSLYEDYSFQRYASKELINYLHFYNETNKQETEFLGQIHSAENAINILHSNNDELMELLKDLKTTYDGQFHSIFRGSSTPYIDQIQLKEIKHEKNQNHPIHIAVKSSV